MPSSSWRSATWSTTVCVSETDNRTRTPGFASAKSQSRSGTTEPPGPVDAPSSSVPLSASSSRATSCRSCSSSASMRCADAYSRRPASVGATRRRGRDGVLRALDIAFASLFLFVSLPLSLAIALLLLATDGLPLFYRGERVGRGGRIFQMLEVPPLKRGAGGRPGAVLGGQPVP